jgi:chaperonin GroES
MSDRAPYPLGKRVLMVKEEAAETSEGGIILVDSAKEKPLTARVVAVGPDVKGVETGEEVIYPAFAATTFQIAGNEVYVIDEDDIMLVLREVPDA